MINEEGLSQNFEHVSLSLSLSLSLSSGVELQGRWLEGEPLLKAKYNAEGVGERQRIKHG